MSIFFVCLFHTSFNLKCSQGLLPYLRDLNKIHTYIDSSRAVYHISLSFRGPQMNRYSGEL